MWFAGDAEPSSGYSARATAAGALAPGPVGTSRSFSSTASSRDATGRLAKDAWTPAIASGINACACASRAPVSMTCRVGPWSATRSPGPRRGTARRRADAGARSMTAGRATPDAPAQTASGSLRAHPDRRIPERPPDALSAREFTDPGELASSRGRRCRSGGGPWRAALRDLPVPRDVSRALRAAGIAPGADAKGSDLRIRQRRAHGGPRARPAPRPRRACSPIVRRPRSVTGVSNGFIAAPRRHPPDARPRRRRAPRRHHARARAAGTEHAQPERSAVARRFLRATCEPTHGG